MASMISRRQPETFLPVRECCARRKLPENLYVVVDNTAFSTFDHQDCSVITSVTGDLRAKLPFTCQNLTQGSLRTHFADSGCLTRKTNFVSVFESKDIALQARSLCEPTPTQRESEDFRATKWIIDTSKLQAGWIDTPSGHVPVWLQYGDQPMIPKNVLYLKAQAMDAFDASIWICVDEIREIFGLQKSEGEKGEWLACGFIPSNMITAQVILQDYQKRPNLAHVTPKESKEVRRSESVGSIRSISTKEQKQHIRAQVLRNKASQEVLRRTREAFKKPSRGREQPLLRQAINNIKRSTSKAEREPPRRPSDTRAAYSEQDDTLPLVTTADIAGNLSQPSQYASIRSPVLREALQRRKPTVSVDRVLETTGSPLLDPQKPTKNHKYSGPEERLRELSATVNCDYNLDSRNSESESLAQGTDDLDFLPRPERLQRARANKRRDDFYALGQNPRLTLGMTTEVESDFSRGSDSLLGCALDVVSTVLDELERRRARPAAPGLQLSDKSESSRQYTPCSVDEQASSAEETPGYEADISDNFSSASEPTPLRRSRKKSAHSRLTTPLGLYKYGHKPTRG